MEFLLSFGVYLCYNYILKCGENLLIMELYLEKLALVSEDGAVIGSASRAECHDGTFLLHRVVHVLVFNDDGLVLLQKRSMNKDIQPGKWDTSVGGHVTIGESVENALVRETEEELGISGAVFEFLYNYIMESTVEREFVSTYSCRWNGRIVYQIDEIDEVRFFGGDEIERNTGVGFFTPNFEDEWRRYLRFKH